ncbi:urease accessory protein UreF [Dyadobacter frigoris]|uniref:Urease accessory protein UreF n=1 Tax=Dyadobacter frigoris TaxID=2576211 RepID=A0A4U6CZN7_9BACT|nr:urease accessory protein UreF [Dyadobacter frigoris]TKT89297.1 urease accessory protein UreF [Dyadobacter frigoris]GLU57076.1 urease accessory protein UreF [Dyadobacter frigoris]
MNIQLLSLLQLSDPTLPIGGYAHSSGLETYVQAGLVKCRKTAEEFIMQMLTKNFKYSDAAFTSLAYDAAGENDFELLLSLDHECSALKLPREMREASQKLGNRLTKIFQPLCGSEIAEKYVEAVKSKTASGHYCIFFGLYAKALHIDKKQMLTGFYYNTTVGFITNSVKLIPLGQQDGQQLLFSFLPVIDQLVEESMQPDRDLLGLCCPGFDIRCIQHESLYSRLYMS